MNYIYSCRRCSKLFISRGVLTVKCSYCKCASSKHAVKRSYYYLLDAQNAIRMIDVDKTFKEAGGGE